jgi:hypothetical protein
MVERLPQDRQATSIMQPERSTSPYPAGRRVPPQFVQFRSEAANGLAGEEVSFRLEFMPMCRLKSLSAP